MRSGKIVGIVDAELLDDQHVRNRFPNLAAMKLAAFHKNKGDRVELILNYSDAARFDLIYVAKVFTQTRVPAELLKRSNVVIGGTGFFFDKYDKAPMLPRDVEHSRPDYALYDNWVRDQRRNGTSSAALKYYTDFSIGYTTRGCVRGCKFCVNKNSRAVLPASPIGEFFDATRKKLCLLDDNVFAYKQWDDVFNELHQISEQFNTSFEFKQGLDIRLLNEEKAQMLARSRYAGDFIFAFDNPKDEAVVSKNLALFRRHVPNAITKAYVLCAYASQDAADIQTVFYRIKVLWEHKCLAYVMRYHDYQNAAEPYRSMYVQLAGWCNQPQFQFKWTFRQFCEKRGCSAQLRKFEKLHPEMRECLDMTYQYGRNTLPSPTVFIEAGRKKATSSSRTPPTPIAGRKLSLEQMEQKALECENIVARAAREATVAAIAEGLWLIEMRERIWEKNLNWVEWLQRPERRLKCSPRKSYMLIALAEEAHKQPALKDCNLLEAYRQCGLVKLKGALPSPEQKADQTVERSSFCNLVAKNGSAPDLPPNRELQSILAHVKAALAISSRYSELAGVNKALRDVCRNLERK